MKLFTQKKLVVALSVVGLGMSFDVLASSTTPLDLDNVIPPDGVATATQGRPEVIKPKDGVRNFFPPDPSDLNIPEAEPNFSAAVSSGVKRPLQFERVCEDNWGGNEMVGMKITFHFAGAPSVSGVLGIVDLVKDTVGITMEGWKYYQSVDTFRRTWHLEPVGTERPTITGIEMIGYHDGNKDDSDHFTVFDVYFGLLDKGSPGSELGRPFEPVSWPDVLDNASPPPLSVIEGAYDGPVSVGDPPGNPAPMFYGDLYNELFIDLKEGWDGNTPVTAAPDDYLGRTTLPYANFIIDTDCVEGPIPPDTFAVPVVDLEAMAILSGIHLKWAPGPVNEPEGYVIYRRPQGGDLELLATVSAPAYKDKNVVSGMVYEYSVATLESGDDPNDLTLSDNAAMVTVTAK